MKNGIIILHYNDRNATIATLRSFDVLDEEFIFIVVDNDTQPQGWTDCLAKEKFSHMVSVEPSGGNIGYAQGLNVGVALLRSQGIQYIWCLNNDLELKCEAIFSPLREIEEQFPKTAVVGPDILTLSVAHTNPYALKRVSDANLLFLYFIVFNIKLRKSVQAIRRTFLRKANDVNEPLPHNDPASVPQACSCFVVHGSALAFLPTFFQHFDECFDPNTFLYCEEWILGERLRNIGLTAYYTPQIQVLHLEDVATKKSLGKNMHGFKLEVGKKSFRYYINAYRGGIKHVFFKTITALFKNEKREGV